MVVISKLQLKQFRDLKTAKLQFGAVVLIILIGIAVFTTLYEAYLNLRTSYDVTFQKLQMADYWITVDQVSQRAIREMNKIPGVNATGRIVGEVSVDLANATGEKVEARLVSVPQDHPPAVNNLLIEQGAYFGSISNREVLVEQSFAKYHKFQPGDRIVLERNGIKIGYTISGIVTSPEYIWVLRSDQDILPTARTFGILFIPQPEAEGIFNMEGLCNEIILSFTPGTDHNQVLTEIKRILRQNGIARVISRDDQTDLNLRKTDILNGVRSAYLTPRKDQATIRLLRQDLDGFSSLAILFPLLFLSMASLTIYVLMSRLVESQRLQIGVMRAIGYSRTAVLLHYIGFGLFVGASGSLIGAFGGHLLSGVFSRYYVAQLNLPYTVITNHWPVLGVGILVGTGIPLIAGILSTWSTLKIHPAEAMRPPAPASGNRGILRAAEIFTRWLPYTLLLPFRNLIRNSRRSLFMALGVMSAVVMVIAAMSFVDAMQQLIHIQYQVIQKYDARVIFQGTTGELIASRISRFAGVTGAEAVLESPYRVKFGNNKIDTSLTGIPHNSAMFGLVTQEGKPVDVVEGGVLIPSAFGKVLGASVGDTLRLEPLVGITGEEEVRLAGFLDFPIGGRGFIPLGEMQRMLRQPGAVSSVFVKFEGRPSADLMKKLYDLPRTATVELASDTQDYINQSMAFFWVFIGVMLLMGGALGAAIIFNGVTVNVLQRTREIAIMRAIGMHRAGLTLIITLENLLIGLIGILIGLPAGRYVAEGLLNSMSTSTEDLFSFSLVISARTYWIAALFALFILLLSQLPAIRRVTTLSLSTATKGWSE